MADLVIGGSGKIGGYIVKHLVLSEKSPFALSRRQRCSPGVQWIRGDLRTLTAFPIADTIYCTASTVLFANALPQILTSSRPKRVIVFSTTSIMTKADSKIEEERVLFAQIAEAEGKIRSACELDEVSWTILRPTLVYDEGRDGNITRLASIIRKFGFMPVIGAAKGLRQPVHAEDLAVAAITCARTIRASNKTYILAGADTVTYSEMVGRIFDGMGRRRLILHLPATVWRIAFKTAAPFFSGFNVAMGDRMGHDMIFDTSAAQRDLNWRPRDFRPIFPGDRYGERPR